MINTSHQGTLAEIACEFGSELWVLSPTAKKKMMDKCFLGENAPGENDIATKTKYWQAYRACGGEKI